MTGRNVGSSLNLFNISNGSFLADLLAMVIPFHSYSVFLRKSSNTQGRSQEFSFTEARLKGKGASNAGGLCPPEADAIHQSHF